MKSSVLSVNHISVTAEGKKLLHDVSMTFLANQTYAVMGPNGSGKSTLAQTIMGNPAYRIQNKMKKEKGGIFLDGEDITNLATEERAKKGLFLVFQSPVAIPGVTVIELLRTAYQEQFGNKADKSVKKIQNPILAKRWTAGQISLSDFLANIRKTAENLAINPDLLQRGVNDGFSGGERKKLELLQALILKPKFAIFDEIDTGLDVDALKIVGNGIVQLHKQGIGIIIITHYQRILRYIQPDRVLVLSKGKVIASGDASLVLKIEKKGYAAIT